MYEDSCTSCKQVYNLPPEEEIESEHVEEEETFHKEEEEKYEYEEDSELDTIQSLSQVSSLSEILVYDGNNFIPEAEDMYLEEDKGNEFNFDEQLFMINRNTKKKVGSMKIGVEHLEQANFFVLVHYFFKKGTKMYEIYNYGYVQKNFDSTNEVRCEVEIDVVRHRTTVHSLYVRPIGKQYVLSEQYRYTTEHFVKNKTKLNFDDMVNVATESAYIILMRQIAKKDFVGYKFLKSIITNREICETQLKCYPFAWCIVNNKKTELKRIRRRVIVPTKEVQESNAYLSRNGQIAMVTWCGDQHYAVINSKSEITPGYHPKHPYFLRSIKKRFFQMPEIKSRIEIDTNRLIMKSKNYIADHPEVMAIISYICKQILLTKPHKVVLFVKRCILPYL